MISLSQFLLIFQVCFRSLHCLRRGNYSIGFVHMRKAGGSLALQIFDDWMRQHDCFRGDDDRVSYVGVQEGIGHIRISWEQNASLTTVPAFCIGVNIFHEEYGCIDGTLLLSILPSREQMRRLNFTLFTTFRDPIERIGSQAFYFDGVYQVPMLEIFNNYPLSMKIDGKYKLIRAMNACRENATIPYCHDLSRAFNETLLMLQSSPELWFNWMENVTFMDGYMPNYYTHRLTGHHISSNGEIRQAANCLQNPHSCQNLNHHSSTLSAIFTSKSFERYAPNEEFAQYRLPISDRTMHTAKRLLKDHFDFVIMEYFNTSATRNAIRYALFDNYNMSAKLSQSRPNRGLIAELSDMKYRDLMPPTVLQRLLRENAADIALYKYAVGLFRRRARAERWDLSWLQC